MAIPGFKVFIRPTLEVIASNKELSRGDIAYLVKEKMNFSDEEASEKLESGQYRLHNRVGWAITYLKKAKLIEFPEKGMLVISSRGKSFLQDHKGGISPSDLEVFPEFLEFRNKKNKKESDNISDSEFEDIEPEEKIDIGYKEIKNTLIDELQNKLLQVKPLKFEQIVLDLIKALGYGTKIDGIKHTGGSGDFGIDGIVYLDRLGIDKIYLQAKRYQLNNKISSSDIQKFFGALKGRKAQKGIFLTTSSYQSSAIKYAESVSDTLILLDGHQVAERMIEANVGVNSKRKIIIPDIDNDYFEE